MVAKNTWKILISNSTNLFENTFKREREAKKRICLKTVETPAKIQIAKTKVIDTFFIH